MAIELGFCQCGCGKETNIRQGHRCGFRQGHYARVHPPKWNGGKKKKHGTPYTLIMVPGHPRADSDDYVREHHLIAEKTLGKFLPLGAVVHHHTPEQLVICQDQGYHRTLHRRTAALEACGHANWRKCRFCKEYDDPRNMAEYSRKGTREGEFRYHHRQCAADYEAQRRAPVAEEKYRKEGVFDGK